MFGRRFSIHIYMLKSNKVKTEFIKTKKTETDKHLRVSWVSERWLPWQQKRQTVCLSVDSRLSSSSRWTVYRRSSETHWDCPSSSSSLHCCWLLPTVSVHTHTHTALWLADRFGTSTWCCFLSCLQECGGWTGDQRVTGGSANQRRRRDTPLCDFESVQLNKLWLLYRCSGSGAPDSLWSVAPERLV